MKGSTISVLVVCDDGSVFFGNEDEWVEAAPIPDTERAKQITINKLLEVDNIND